MQQQCNYVFLTCCGCYLFYAFAPFYDSLFPVGTLLTPYKYFFVYFFGGLVCVGHSFAYVAHFLIYSQKLKMYRWNYILLDDACRSPPTVVPQEYVKKNMPFCYRWDWDTEIVSFFISVPSQHPRSRVSFVYTDHLMVLSELKHPGIFG